MTIDEAICHCEEVARSCDWQAAQCDETDGYECHEKAGNEQCATDHRQLAEWLTELKELREQNAELKSILNGALKDIPGKNICEVMNACKLCAMKFQQLCDIFPWQYADEALKLIGDESNDS